MWRWPLSSYVLLSDALAFVSEALQNRWRKDNITPLDEHAKRVVIHLRIIGVTDEEELIAGALHDLEEDLGRYLCSAIRISRIADQFGTRVRELIDHQQEERFDQLGREPDEERRLRYAELLGRVRAWEAASCRIKLCDIAANLTTVDGFPDPFCPETYRDFHVMMTIPTLLLRLAELDQTIDEALSAKIFATVWPLAQSPITTDARRYHG